MKPFRFVILFFAFAILLLAFVLFLEPRSSFVETPRIHELSEKIENAPKDPYPLSERGYAYAILGERKDALADYKNALTLKPKDLHTHWSYGWALFNLSDYQGAVDEWNYVLDQSDPRPWWVGHTLALGYWQLGQKQKALQYYDEAVKRSPEKFSNRKGLLEYTHFWNSGERAVIEQVYDAWNHSYKGNDEN